MKMIYISKVSIEKAINYFVNTSYNSPEQIGLFFVFKGLGYNNKEYVTFSKEPKIKKQGLRLLYQLSALFDRDSEIGKKSTSLFPFAFQKKVKKSCFYNPGTPFASLYGRIKDTIDNTLVDDGKFMKKDELNDGNYKFTANYIEVLKNSFLNNKKISWFVVK